MIRRINLYGGPGSGKSTLAAKLFAEFKSRNKNVELVGEYVKSWAYQKIPTNSFSQYYIFAKQLRAEDIFLSNGVEVIISDSPLILQIAYWRKNNVPGVDSLRGLISSFESEYPSFNIFLDREGLEFSSDGRYETSVEDALKIDAMILEELESQLPLP